MSSWTAEKRDAQVKVFRSPVIDLSAMQAVRSSLFTLTKALLAKLSTPAAGDGIVEMPGIFVQVHTALAETVLHTWGDKPADVFGARGWWLVRTTFLEYLQFLRSGQEVIGSPNTVMFNLSDADYVQNQFRELYQVLEQAIKQRDPTDNSPLDVSIKSLLGGRDDE